MSVNHHIKGLIIKRNIFGITTLYHMDEIHLLIIKGAVQQHKLTPVISLDTICCQF